jgi:1,2-phenylacetyl-CoA epoxidase PaaB subunit
MRTEFEIKANDLNEAVKIAKEKFTRRSGGYCLARN